MQIHTAISKAAAAEGWTATKIASEAGVTEAAARRWLSGRSIPAGDTLLRLIEKLPGLRAALNAPEAVAP